MGLNNRECADRIGISASYLTYLYQKKRRLMPDKALQIVNATEGAVTLEELLFPDTDPTDPK